MSDHVERKIDAVAEILGKVQSDVSEGFAKVHGRLDDLISEHCMNHAQRIAQLEGYKEGRVNSRNSAGLRANGHEVATLTIPPKSMIFLGVGLAIGLAIALLVLLYKAGAL